MTCPAKALLKAAQFVVCLGGLMYKVWTSWESQRVSLSLQKESKDWLLRRGFADPSSLDSIYIDLAFGTFTVVTLALLLGHLAGDPRTAAEKLLMVFGFIAMVIVGGILITSTDDMPDRLYDNAIILGVLAFVAGVLFLTDAGTKCSGKKKRPPAPVIAPKRTVEIVPKVEKKEEETTAVVHKEEVKEEKKEEQKNGIKSVEIRIKDPTKPWPVYGQKSKSLAEIESLAEAERVDSMLQDLPQVSPILLQEARVEREAREQRATVHPSPVRHTSSFYITGPFSSWKRLGQNNK